MTRIQEGDRPTLCAADCRALHPEGGAGVDG